MRVARTALYAAGVASYLGKLVTEDESKLPPAQADYLNDYIERKHYSKKALAAELGMDPSSLSRILNRTAGVGMDKYYGLLRCLGLRCEIVEDPASGDEFNQLGEGIRRSLFEWSASVEALRKRYADVQANQGEELVARVVQPVRKRAPRRPKKAGDGGGP